MKICTKCNIEEYDDSVRKNKSNTWCNACHKQYKIDNKEKIKKQRAKYRQEHKIEIGEKNKEYTASNKEKVQASRKAHYLNNADRLKAYTKTYRLEHLSLVKENNTNYFRNRRLNDPEFKLRGRISTFIRAALKSRDGSKNGQSCLKYLSYSIRDLKEYLEKQFEPWMTWENHGIYNANTWDDSDSSTWTWQIDHIIPQSTFAYSSMEDEAFKKCWSLDNLRPLSAKQNYLDGVRRVRH
jgi:hypothetical protein